MTWDTLFWIAVAICATGSSWVLYQIWKEARELRVQQRAYDKAQAAAEATVARLRAERQARYQRFVRHSVARDGKPWEHQR